MNIDEYQTVFSAQKLEKHYTTNQFAVVNAVEMTQDIAKILLIKFQKWSELFHRSHQQHTRPISSWHKLFAHPQQFHQANVMITVHMRNKYRLNLLEHLFTLIAIETNNLTSSSFAAIEQYTVIRAVFRKQNMLYRMLKWDGIPEEK